MDISNKIFPFQYSISVGFFSTLLFFSIGNLIPTVMGVWFISNIFAGFFILCCLELLTIVLKSMVLISNINYYLLTITKRALLFGFIVDGFKVGS